MTIDVSERQTSEFSGGYIAGSDFAFSFRLHDATMLEVVIRTDGGEPIAADPSDYSVALNADQYVSPGGTVTFETAVLSTETLQIRSDLAMQQQSDLTVSNTFNPRTVEDAVDYLMMCMQDMSRQLSEGIGSRILIKIISATTYTILNEDSGYALRFTSDSAIALTVNDDVALAGFNFVIVQAGLGKVTWGGTASLRNYDDHTQTAGQDAVVGFLCDTTGSFVVSGRTS